MSVRKRKCVYTIKYKTNKGYKTRWVVRVTENKERKYLGCFNNRTKALAAYKAWEATQ